MDNCQNSVASISNPDSGSDLARFRTGDVIYAESWSRCGAASDLSHLPKSLHGIALRLVHSCGDATIVESLKASANATESLRHALKAGAKILVDAEMVAAGIIRAKLPAANAVVCTLNYPQTTGLAQEFGETRSAAAVRLWRDEVSHPSYIGPYIAVIGNAPTALARLLELVSDGSLPPPKVVIGFAVGFVAASEAKSRLMAQDSIDWIALEGTRGGSALAAAVINAITSEIAESQP